MSLCETCEKFYDCGDDQVVKCPFYVFEKGKKGSDKPDHFSRSAYHQPNHLKVENTIFSRKQDDSSGQD